MEYAEVKYNVLGAGAVEHNQVCHVCWGHKGVMWMDGHHNPSIIQPCWNCQKHGFFTVKLNWIDRLFGRGKN